MRRRGQPSAGAAPGALGWTAAGPTLRPGRRQAGAFSLVALSLAALGLAGCSHSTPSAATTWPLTVVGGYGSGDYAPGEAVHVWSDVDPQAARLTGWRGSGLEDPNEWNSGLVMPDEELTLTASTVTSSDDVAERSVTLADGDRTVLAAVPEDARALVLFFHGASYNRTEIQSNAGATLTHQLVAAGYGVVAVDSVTAWTGGTGGWNDDPGDAANADLALVSGLVQALRDDGTIGLDTPIVALGMSSGGQFAHAVGLALPAQAVVAFCAPGRSDTIAATSAPTAWFLAAADSIWPTGEDDANLAAAGLAARGLAAEVHVHPPTPLYDQRFQRVSGVDASTSLAIADELRDAGFVDGHDGWLVPGMTATASPLAATSGLSAEQVVAVDAEIEIMAAEHELYDDYAARVIAFLGTAL